MAFAKDGCVLPFASPRGAHTRPKIFRYIRYLAIDIQRFGNILREIDPTAMYFLGVYLPYI